MDLGIAGRVALVTAGTRGIGLGIANALVAEGVRVAVAARTESDVKKTAAALGGVGVVADLMTEDGCRRSVKETEKALGPIDILVNNLGLRAGSSWSDTGTKEFETAFAGNVTVSVGMTQLVLAGMLLRGWGRAIALYVVAFALLVIATYLMFEGNTKSSLPMVWWGIGISIVSLGCAVGSVLLPSR